MNTATDKKERLMQGNAACAEGAIAAGARFFAGYPITPSTEIAEYLARELPKVGGKFIQMEDEIASMAAVIGASVAGVKSMTATSGPGFSLIQEHIGYAYMAEVPCVVVDVQRGGPSTGLPTKVSQSDTMQARWGTHGDYNAIALGPSSVKECFDFTVRAFNLSEKYRTPVVVLMDEVLAHMREKVTLPDSSEIRVINRMKPTVPPEWYEHFEINPHFVSPMASFGEGYRFNITGLTHNPEGFPTSRPVVIKEKLDKLKNKITHNINDIVEVRQEFMEDANVAVFAYGIVARSARQAIRMGRDKRIRVGLIQPLTIWPFPDEYMEHILEQLDLIIVVELNQGQLIREVNRVNRGRTRVRGLFRYDSELITPDQIFRKIREEK
ncbi:2-oxoglutarate ferredoxin oxidoreductase subunit alpha [candidate division WOR-1 bacterium DG_54_3]|uniref:2-oxoglutarate ferredoxin oxidoreductase subunit alpha n=1 Tax=candidate division WOR-1 bacterium DG_54_3 TaxID=1703775 RepID=A0A0S7XS88_UNCSA|nr:MAG: 2-oxoglutarate ferredoxin oxidoreductase subunit alpha [candidate division WOR-1 bacterium DG_54_3]